MRIYMDVCCFNRPQDDSSIGRNRLEAQAVLTVLRHVELGRWHLVGSDAIDAEISVSPSPDRKSKATPLAALRSSCVLVTSLQVLRARQLAAFGLKSFDALHTACAESAKCDVLLTTDDKFIARYNAHQNDIMVRVVNPLAWITEVNVT